MTKIVGERQSFRQVLVKPERAGERAAIWVTSSVWVRRVRK
jgi:hypothetical protein